MSKMLSTEAFNREVIDFDGFGTLTHLVPFEWEVNGQTGMTIKG